MEQNDERARLGLHRVLEPAGAMPQAAERLDPALPHRDEEIVIEVDVLNIDSASFAQIVGQVGRDEEAVGRRVLEIVRQRGKMQNPETGSGGMLLGTVSAMGAGYRSGAGVTVGDRVATLVSLTLTPLHIEEILAVHLEADQVRIRGHAVLWPTAPIVRMPSDLPEDLALACLDVCGAPAQVARLVRPGMRVLVLGAGKSGLLCMAQARAVLGETGRLVAADLREGWLLDAVREGLVDASVAVDATDPVATWERVLPALGGELADLVINTANVSRTEMSAILTARDGGVAYFFNMATSFSRATLGAEGIGRDVALLMGNGYAPGHAALALDLLRGSAFVRERFAALAGMPGPGQGP